MSQEVIHIEPGNQFSWIVRQGDIVRGQYPTKRSAEVIGGTIARKQKAELVIHDGGGKIRRKNFAGWSLTRLIGGAG